MVEVVIQNVDLQLFPRFGLYRQMKKTEFVSLHFLHFVVSGGHQNARLEEVEMEDQNRSVFDLRNQIVQLVQFGHVDNLVSLCKMVED